MPSLLDRYDQIQRNPLGSNTATSRTSLEQGNPYGQLSTAGKQYRALEQSYGRALRILNHAARRGDARAALQSIAVRQQAMGEGFSPGGIRRVDERNEAMTDLVRGRAQATRDMTEANALKRRDLQAQLDALDAEEAAAANPDNRGPAADPNVPYDGSLETGTATDWRGEDPTVSTGVRGASVVEGATGLGRKVSRFARRLFGLGGNF